MAQFRGSLGTKFYLMIPGKDNTSQASVYISSDYAISQTARLQIGGSERDIPLAPSSVTKVDLPSDVAGTTGIIITTNFRVSVYGVSTNGNSSEAFMVYPVTGLGTDYIIPSFSSDYGAGSQFGIVSTENITYTQITPTEDVPNHRKGYPYSLVLLGEGQVKEETNLGTSGDFTGTIIHASKPIGVFAGHQDAYVPGFYTYPKSNRVVEMVPPTSAWGRKVITVPSKGLVNAGDTWRILASDDNTIVYLNGTPVRGLDRKGMFFDIVLKDAAMIEGNKPILVTQYPNASSSPGTLGAPFSIIAPPVEQYQQTHLVSTIGSHAVNFLNIVAHNAELNYITLDNQPVPASSFKRVGNSEYAAAQIQVDSGTHRVVGPLGVGVTVYGFGERTAYGYSAGQSTADVAKVWKLELQKPADTLGRLREATYNAFVMDASRKPVQGVMVTFTIKGPDSIRMLSTYTDTTGIASFSFVGEGAGNDTVTAAVGTVKDSKIINWTPGPCHTLALDWTLEEPTGDNVNGMIKLSSPFGGIPPYTFYIDNRSNTSGIFDSVSYGKHVVQVQDGRYCAATWNIEVKRKIITDSSNQYAFPKDSLFTFQANEVSCEAIVRWKEPDLANPATIGLPPAYNDPDSKLFYKGSYNGHAYYQSTGFYLWQTAKYIAIYNYGHLVTVNSAGENDFIRTKLKQEVGYGPWIGLSNTGTVGQFAWVTGEPFNYSYWYPTEPNNGGWGTDTVAEKYVHIWGYDQQNRWNDLNEYFYLPFIEEFEGPILSYKQVKGPANGSSMPVGTYQVCYEVYNRLENKTYTYCFNVKVECLPGAHVVQGDTVIVAPAGSCKAALKWRQPVPEWPQQIWPPQSPSGEANWLQFKTAYDGHGYYLSNSSFTWPASKIISERTGGHLATIGNAGENNAIVSNFKTPGSYGPWIGLYNVGRTNTFTWIDDTRYPEYTNWAPNEPNNQGGEDEWDIREPYVLLNNYDYAARWNDMPATYSAPFITEFDGPVNRYIHLSGPEWGTIVDTGTYTICYRVDDLISKVTGTRCFTIKVVCGPPSIASTSVAQAKAQDESAIPFKATVAPNPSATNFKIKVGSGNTVQRVSLKVVDVSGRVVETRNNVMPNTTITLGDSYARGIYFVQIIQGTKQEVLKVVKE